MKTKIRKGVALLLALTMCVGMVCTTALAAEDSEGAAPALGDIKVEVQCVNQEGYTAGSVHVKDTYGPSDLQSDTYTVAGDEEGGYTLELTTVRYVGNTEPNRTADEGTTFHVFNASAKDNHIPLCDTISVPLVRGEDGKLVPSDGENIVIEAICLPETKNHITLTVYCDSEGPSYSQKHSLVLGDQYSTRHFFVTNNDSTTASVFRDIQRNTGADAAAYPFVCTMTMTDYSLKYICDAAYNGLTGIEGFKYLNDYGQHTLSETQAGPISVTFKWDLANKQWVTEDTALNVHVQCGYVAPVAEIVGGGQYGTLQAAINAAEAGDTVVLLKDVRESISVTRGKDVILDLNGKTVHNGTERAITVINQGTLTIKDSGENGTIVSEGGDDAVDNYGTLNVESGTIRTTAYYGICAVTNGSVTNVYGTAKVIGAYWGIAAYDSYADATTQINVYGNAEISSTATSATDGGISAAKSTTKVYGDAKVSGSCGINTEGSLTISGDASVTATHTGAGTGIGLYKGADVLIEGGTIQGGAYGVSGNGSADGTTITITGGEISGEACGVYHPQAGTLTISGGEITGAVGVQMCDGELNVSGDAQITGTGADERETKTGDGAILDGAAISLVKRGGGYGTPSAQIEGGLFISEQTEAIIAYSWTNGDPKAVEWTDIGTFVSGGTFSSDVTGYTVEGKACHAIGGSLYNVHTPDQAGMAYDDDGHWLVCAGHTDCQEGGTAEPHTYTDEVTTPAGYGTAGVRTYTCACGDSYTETIPALARPSYTLTVRYVDGEGNELAPAYSERLTSGSGYSVTSPVLEGYTADQLVVSGDLYRTLTLTVTYTADPVEESVETEPVESEPVETQEPDEELDDQEPPLAEMPDEEPAQEQPALPAEEPDEELTDGDVPLADVPQTGDALALWLAAMAASGFGLACLKSRKKDEDEA